MNSSYHIPSTMKLLRTLVCQRLSAYLFSLLFHAVSIFAKCLEGKKNCVFEDSKVSNFVFPALQDPKSSAGPLTSPQSSDKAKPGFETSCSVLRISKCLQEKSSYRTSAPLSRIVPLLSSCFGNSLMTLNSYFLYFHFHLAFCS